MEMLRRLPLWYNEPAIENIDEHAQIQESFVRDGPTLAMFFFIYIWLDYTLWGTTNVD